MTVVPVRSYPCKGEEYIIPEDNELRRWMSLHTTITRPNFRPQRPPRLNLKPDNVHIAKRQSCVLLAERDRRLAGNVTHVSRSCVLVQIPSGRGAQAASVTSGPARRGPEGVLVLVGSAANMPLMRVLVQIPTQLDDDHIFTYSG